MFTWFKKLFWKRCHYCKQKREFFFYTWELPGWSIIVPKNNSEYEVCTECARKKPEDFAN